MSVCPDTPTRVGDSASEARALEVQPPSTAPGLMSDVAVPLPLVSESSPRIRVLVVDEHPLIRAGIRTLLATMNDVELVAELAMSDSVVRVAERSRPDVVFIDIDATDSRGVATIEALIAMECHPRVIALTLRSDDETLIHALNAGASGVISKEDAEDDIATALRTVASDEIYIRQQALSKLASTVRPNFPSHEERTARKDYDGLSARERAVLGYVATGLTGPEVGQLLHITAKTVDTYRHRIREKIGLLHRADYIRFALLIGVLKK